MTIFRVISQVLGALLLGAVGMFAILEATGEVGQRWRSDIADGLSDAAFPDWSPWASALLGAGLAITGAILVAAQIAPPTRGFTRMLEVHATDAGRTVLRGRAALGAVRHVLQDLPGVVGIDARLAGKKRVVIELKIDDHADLRAVEDQARERLDTPFWMNLGLVDLAVNILITHERRPPGGR